jgi:NAD(P)-dependent dehydrogenase (short-subunit alcohol dehydrogenase family)
MLSISLNGDTLLLYDESSVDDSRTTRGTASRRYVQQIKPKEMTMTEVFNATSTTADVLAGVNLRGKRILVTGASAGLGVETARILAAHGAQVIGAARDLTKAKTATLSVCADAANGGGLELVELDLASLASVRACADALLAVGKPFDLVIANAGVMATPFGHTADGFEIQLGTNHLGHFVLVNRLAELMVPGARLVNLASSAHRRSDVDLEDPSFEHTPYSEHLAYGRSKTANILFAVEFDRRHKERNVRATAVHPGAIQTELGRHSDPVAMQQRFDEFNAKQISEGKQPFQWKTIPQGAATSVWAGVVASAEEVGGRYCENCHVTAVTEEWSMAEGLSSYAVDPDRAKSLWAMSEAMVDERF